MRKALAHKAELKRKKRNRGNVEQLKSKTARKKGGQVYVINPGRQTGHKRGPGRSKMERDLDRAKKDLKKREDALEHTIKNRGPVGEVVATIYKTDEIILFVRASDGSLDRKVRKRSYGG